MARGDRRAHAPRPKLEYDWLVRGRLAQGSYPDPAAFKSGRLEPGHLGHPEHAWGEFDVLVFCAEELQPMHLRNIAPPGKVAVFVPMDDTEYRPIDMRSASYLDQLAVRLAAEMRAGRSVLVTCHQGMNRSGLLSALVLRCYEGLTGAQALHAVQSRRRAMRGFVPLGNMMFARFLELLPRR